MKDDLTNRVLNEADYIIDSRCTVRECGKYFGISKSTVHKDMTKRLSRISPGLYDGVRKVLDENKAQRHIRGGIATKNKYLSMQDNEKKIYKEK